MEDFQIIKPSPLLSPYIKHYWWLKTSCPTSEHIRTVPTGHVTLIFHRGNRILSNGVLQPRAFLCGHENSYSDLFYSGVTDMICVVFKPVGAKVFFHIPMSEVNNRQIDLYDLEDTRLTDLEKSLTDTQTPRNCIALIEKFLLERINSPAGYNLKRIDAAVKIINAGQTDVNTLSVAACLSYKQFSRVFTEHVGAKPKEFLRIIRFQRALFLLQSQPEITLAQLAYDCGYYDQPHLIKEFKTFSGYTPLEYIAVCAPYSDYFS